MRVPVWMQLKRLQQGSHKIAQPSVSKPYLHGSANKLAIVQDHAHMWECSAFRMSRLLPSITLQWWKPMPLRSRLARHWSKCVVVTSARPDVLINEPNAQSCQTFQINQFQVEKHVPCIRVHVLSIWRPDATSNLEPAISLSYPYKVPWTELQADI